MSGESLTDEHRDGPGVAFSSLEEHAAVHAAVVASALDAVIVVDEDGLVVALNPAAERMFGYRAQDALGHSIGELIVPDEMRQAHENGMARYRASLQPRVLGRRVEMPARCRDGRIIPVELAITEVVLPGRRLFTANLRDLSDAKAANSEIERQRDALHQSEKLAAIGSLLAGVAHELNNPLSVVLGQAIMMREEAQRLVAGSSLRERAGKIEAAAERCARVVRSFLAIARQRKAEQRAIAMPELLEGAIDLLVYNLNSSGIEVTRDYEEDLPEVFADPDQVSQIVVNLLVNAAQAMEADNGRKRVLVQARMDEEGRVRVLVADSGPGVPKELRSRIFEPFFTTKASGSGTGIGLSVSRGLAESQKGRLELAESPLGGAAFALSLPAAGPQPSRAEQATAAPDASPAPPAPRRALVVDDEAEIAILLAEVLRMHGYACDVANGGREAQAFIAGCGGEYDALICDLRMPEMGGPELFEWIGVHFPALGERTLFVTGDALSATAGRFLARSGRPVVEKPFAPAEIIALVSSFPPQAARA